MATAKLEKVERDFLTCAICLEHYTDPITLDCQHSFCRQCISDYIKTRAEAREKKLIPCPCCSQMSRVPHPTRPVEEWAGQFKLGFVIQGLIDTLTTEDVQKEESVTQTCTLCHQLGELTPGVLWCPECEVSLCDRCVKMHRIQPVIRDHKLVKIEEKGRTKKRRKVMCKEHQDEQIKFYCHDCDKALCHLCSVVYHRKCESIVTIKSMMPKIKTDIADHRRKLSEKVNLVESLTKSRQGSIVHLQAEKSSIQEEIRNAGQRAIEHIKQKERQLMDELIVVTNTRAIQLKSDIKKGDTEKQRYRQYGEYIDQVLTSDCEMDIFDAFQTWKSGCLDIIQDNDTKPAKQQASLVKFKSNKHNIDTILGELSLGEIICSIYDPILTPVLYSTTDGRTESKEKTPDLYDVTVPVADGVRTTVVTDHSNKCLKSLYTKHGQTCHGRLPLDNMPSCITKFKEDKVMVAFRDSFTPDLALGTTITTGNNSEAARMMLQHGKVEKALEFAEKGDDQIVLGDCHHAQALTLMSSKDGFNQESIIWHLNSARDAFAAVGKIDAVGVACLALATIKFDKETAKKAFQSFRNVKPFENEVGKLEALDLIVQMSSMGDEFADIMAVIRGIDSLFAVMKALLKPTTTEEKSKSQLYLQFYGLHEKDANTLIVYPKQRPRCVRVIPDLFATKLEKKQDSVEKEKKWICVKISIYLVEMLKNWMKTSRDSLRSHVGRRLQCKSHMEGEECPDADYCTYLHMDYTRTSAFIALEALLWEVHLDSILQTGVKNIKALSLQGLEAEVKRLYIATSSLIDESTQFDSCERLLDFLVPEHHHMTIITENTAVTRDLIRRLSFGKVSVQVGRFFDQSWMFPDGKFSTMELLEKRSKSTDWFVRASLFSSLFKLKIDIPKVCQQLERDLMKYAPKWLDKRRKYALFVDVHSQILTVECLGRRFCEVLDWLQDNPLKAIIEYAKFVKILSDRGRLSMFPKVPHLLFWQEVFVCVAFFSIARLTFGNFVLPATYLATVTFVNAIFSREDVSIQELVHRSSDRKEHIQVVKDRFLQFAGVLCGERINLLRMIFTAKKDGSEIKYLQAERCLVLALVVLVNIETFVSEELENPLMSTIMKLNLSSDAPTRLRNTLQAVKKSKGTQDIVAILRDLLFEREEEYLLTCYWKWDNQQKQGAQFQQLKKLDAFPRKFSVFDPDNMLSDEEVLIFDDEEELDQTPEEVQRRQDERRQYEEDLRKHKAAKKLQHFFKMLTFMGRLESGNFLRICMIQEVKELFAPFEVTEKMCGVCGVWFQSDVLAMKYLTEEEVNDSLMDAAMQTSSPEAKSVWSPGSLISAHLESHINTREHIQMKFQFETFRSLHDDYFVQKVPEMRRFITRVKLRDQDFTSEHYPDQALDVSRLTSQMDEILAVHKAVLSERHWTQAATLRKIVVRLYGDFTRVGPEIIAKYKEYVEQRQQVLDTQTETKGGGGGRRLRAENQDSEDEHYRGFDRGRERGYKRCGGREVYHRDLMADFAPRFQRMQQLNAQYKQKRHQEQRQQVLDTRTETLQQKEMKDGIRGEVDETVLRKKEPRGRPRGVGGGRRLRVKNQDREDEHYRAFGRGRGRGRETCHRDFVADVTPRFQRMQQLIAQYQSKRHAIHE